MNYSDIVNEELQLLHLNSTFLSSMDKSDSSNYIS